MEPRTRSRPLGRRKNHADVTVTPTPARATRRHVRTVHTSLYVGRGSRLPGPGWAGAALVIGKPYLTHSTAVHIAKIMKLARVDRTMMPADAATVALRKGFGIGIAPKN